VTSAAPGRARRGRRRGPVRFVGRVLLALIGAALALVVAVFATRAWWVPRVGGAFTHPPHEWKTALSPAARALVEAAYADLPSAPVDHHVHLAGLGGGGTGTWVNPAMSSWAHPILHVKFDVYLSACGVDDLAHADEQMLARLVALGTEAPKPGRLCLLAFDRHYEADGTLDLERSPMYVPNERVFAVASQHPDLLVPVMSVHPWRRDALAELDRCAAKGARLCKWLPNAMGIDPADPRCDAFYDRMRELGVALLSHAGREEAVEAADAQKLGNPLRLRRALDHGVKVIVAHCASFGVDEDLDDPARPRVPTFDLFLRLMAEKKYEGLVFGELSAMTEFNRDLRVWRILLERTDLHPRLVNGSDYPIPAIHCLVWTGRFAKEGFITNEEKLLLDEIYGVNPLVFDFVMKRRLKHPQTGARFPTSVFVQNPAIALR
jgi:predicted TIM-barrel fold metal-dependent hydrolase